MTTPPPRPSLWSHLVRDADHGPLPLLLLGLTALTGVIDAVSILGLGRVFVANMTGNIVFIGFALAHAPGFSLSASLAALVGFLAGAFGGGVMVARFAQNRGLLLRNTGAVQFVLIAAALLIVLPSADVPGRGARIAAAALCAAAMGLQNTCARRLAVPDLTTTVLTMTLTGIAADAGHSSAFTSARRVLAVTTMLVGAIAGAVLVLHTRLAVALGLALVLLAAVTVAAGLASRRVADWQHALAKG
jgi:uncharacterized membrane protein YoaK (UPF0700 family)